MNRKINSALLLLACCLGAPSLGATTLGGLLAEEAQLTFEAGSRTSAPWLTIGPLVGATHLRLTLRGAGVQSVIDLPTFAGIAVTWSVPLPAGTLEARLQGLWRANPALRASRSPASSPLGVVITRFNTAQGEPGYRFEIPVWTTTPGYTPVLELEAQSPRGWKVLVKDGKNSRQFVLRGDVKRWTYSQRAWGVEPRVVTLVAQLAGDKNFRVDGLRATGVADGQPLPADTATLLEWPPGVWRQNDREWFAWSASPPVLVLVSGTYALQEGYFKRLAFFVEKTGYRGQILTDDELAGQHGWNAHDYDAPDLAKFFTLARSQSFPLNKRELELLDHLVAAGILVKVGTSSYEARNGAVLGVSAESPLALRQLLFTHEAFHGLYFTTPEFRQGVRDLWNQLSPVTKTTFRSFLAFSQYDPTNEALMINEFQSYVLQQSAAAWPAFVQNRVLSRAPPLTTTQKSQVWTELLVAGQGLKTLIMGLFGAVPGDLRSVWPLPYGGAETKE